MIQRRWRVVVALLSVLAAEVVVAAAAGAVTTTYSAEETIPVPPASGFQGSGGGDGWAVALTPTSVYNVHHHNSTITVACRRQVDASQCWSSQTKQATDANGGTFSTLHPGLHLDQGSGRLYVYATRNADGVGGVVCLDTAVADAEPNPFCGFSALTAPGQSSYGYLTNGVSVGSRFYAGSHDNGSGIATTVLCFDVVTAAGCPGQPYAVDVGSASTGNANTISAVGARLHVPNAGHIGCFDTTSTAECSGSWPVPAPTGYGAPFPLLDASGNVVGACNPDGTVPCFDLSGSVVPTPVGLSGAVGRTQYWNGPALAIGSRVYVPSGTNDTVACYDYATAAACPNFPHSVPGANYLYTVNPDPQRPTCIWVNADNGVAQIQNFDAFGGTGCGEGPIRVLASSIVVPSPPCTPTAYTSLAVLDPARDQYGTGSVAFEDGSGRPIPGVEDVPLDDSGVADLRGLDLNTDRGLPQFLITLTDPAGSPGSVTVRLTWAGESDPNCDPDGGGSSLNVVVLGDSFASGHGAGGYGVSGKCKRSDLAWAHQLDARSSQLNLAGFFACSGAVIDNIVSTARYGEPAQVNQLRQLVNSGTRVDVVMISIGGNDFGLATVITDCFIKDCSRGRLQNPGPRLNSIQERVTNEVVPAIRAAAPGARVVIVAYPRLFPDQESELTGCGWLEPAEWQLAKGANAGLSNRARWAAEDTGSIFADTYNALDGVELCSGTGSHVNPVATGGTDSAHPDGLGYFDYARSIEANLISAGLITD